MNCLEFRRILTSDPGHQDADCAAHRAECESCERYAVELADFDNLIRQAMAVPVPEKLGGQATETVRRAPRPRILALAASLVLAVGAGFAAWQFGGGDALSDELIAHIYHEPDLLLLTADTVEPVETVDTVLRRANVSLKHDIGAVAHAGLCYFRGKLVAHLVVAGKDGPVTVMLLPDEHVDEPTRIREDGFEGTIVPLERGGAVAVIGTQGEDTEPVETRFSEAVEWRI